MSEGWLNKKDFELLDDLFGKMGFGSYYDFLECLKEIGSNIGAYTVEGGEIDRDDLKTIMDVYKCLDSWSSGILQFRLKNNFQFDEEVLEFLTVEGVLSKKEGKKCQK